LLICGEKARKSSLHCNVLSSGVIRFLPDIKNNSEGYFINRLIFVNKSHLRMGLFAEKP